MKFSTIFWIISLIVLGSCSYIIKQFEGNGSYDVIDLEQKQLSLVFSHNINGETHPCGCRHFPLGGLPQVAGQIEELKQQGEVLYIDTGDTFFPSSVIPDSLARSLKFGATNLAKGLDQLKLKYFVPGDQDFAAGPEFLKEMVEDHNFKFLVANFANQQAWPHKRWVEIKRGPHHVFLIGIVDPQAIPSQYSHLFSSPKLALEKTLLELNKSGYRSTNPFHRLIVLSHSGIDQDETFAKNFPTIDWIIGAHSQSFIRTPVNIGETKLVQVLSRNHHLGEVRFNLQKDKSKDQYFLHEVREGLEKKLSPNPFTTFIDAHKAELNRIRDLEQSHLGVTDNSLEKMPTTASCLECHQKQATHWQKTSHSVAYATLIKVQESNKLACIKCHSLGLGDPNGFENTKDMVVFQKQNEEKTEESRLEELRTSYWKEVENIFAKSGPIRRMKDHQKIAYSNKWLALDETFNEKSGDYKITHNFANVQCLNCHQKSSEHPFEIGEEKLKPKQKYAQIKNRCLNCHTADQSPEWYKSKDNGVPEKLNELVFLKHYQRISCPKKSMN